jgi:hypothetical protein
MARTNYEGWHTFFVEWLKTSKLKLEDALFIFSVGGGNIKKLSLLGYDLDQYLLDTVKVFHADALAAGYRL